MNLSQLRKQAKNLKQLFPELVATHGNELTLSQALEAVARSHGYPSWSAAVAKAEPPDAGRLREVAPSDIGTILRAGYAFALSEDAELAVDLDDNGEPTRYAAGHEAILCLRQRADAIAVRREDDALDALSDRLGGVTGSFSDYTARSLAPLLRAAREAVARCPLFLDGWSRVAGLLFTQHKFAEALAVAEPVATALLNMLPTAGVVQVRYGHLENRPFFRIVHCHLLLLHQAGRHREADALAARMYRLWPGDNMGFRFLLDQASREE
jgi:hypothetical protein